jgi:exonuclease SbcC
MDPDRRFSQGQKQDFALSIFLARARGLGGTFFLDEPLAHLDDLNRVALLDVFRAICLESQSKLSIVLTTASKPVLRHIVEKFARVRRMEAGSGKKIPILKVIGLEGNPRSGIHVVNSGAEQAELLSGS